MATVKFWQGMDKASNIVGVDKMMIGKDETGEAQYVDFQDANQFLNVQGIEMKPVAPGALPAGPSGQVRTMEILQAGTYTYGGNSFVNPSGSIMKLWWDGTTWSLGSSVPLPTTPAASEVIEGGSDATSQDAVYQYLDPVIAQSNALTFTLEKGYVKEDGTMSESTSWIHAIINLPTSNGGTFTIEGYGISTGTSAAILASTRVNLFNDSGYQGKISSAGFNTKFTFSAPSGINILRVNIDAASGVGADIPNSPYWNTFKIYEGTELKGKKLKASELDGDITTPQIQDLENTVKISALSGNGAPPTQLGIDGNTYLDRAAGLSYKKQNGSWGNGEAFGGQKRKFIYPTGFSWVPFNIYQLSSNGMYVPEITDISQLVLDKIKDMTPYFVDPLNGLDTNTGLSESDPLNSVIRALALGASLIYCMEGTYNRSQGITLPIITKNTAIIAYKGGKVNMSSWDNGNTFTWTQDGTAWYTSRTGVDSIIDTNYTDEYGYIFYEKKNTLDECKATAGSYFLTGSTVYVHTKDSVKPDFKIKLNLKVETCRLTLGANIDFVYLEGIISYSSNAQAGIQLINNTTTQYQGKGIAKNCNSIYNFSGNGLKFNNLFEAYNQNCGAVKCMTDALNYHTSISSFVRMKVVEMNGWSKDTGYNAPAESSSNGSTAHDGIKIIRFGGKFDVARGSTIADVNDGTESMLFNPEASGSYLPNTAGIQIQDGKMWVFGGYAHTSSYGAKCDKSASSTSTPVMYYDTDTLFRGTVADTIGNVIPYTGA